MRPLRLIGYWRTAALDVGSNRGDTIQSLLGLDVDPDERHHDAEAAASPDDKPPKWLLRAGWWGDRDENRHWPRPAKFVDPAWGSEERALVTDHLARGAHLIRWRGLSGCRFCGRNNGSAEFTDGSYYWPEGLAHYVREHDVRLPDEFVDFVSASPPLFPGHPMPEFDELGQRRRAWSGGEAGSVSSLGMEVHFGRPPESGAEAVRCSWVENARGDPYEEAWVEIDTRWWKAQRRLRRRRH